MGLFDKIKDNAKDLSIKAIEASQEETEEEVYARPITELLASLQKEVGTPVPSAASEVKPTQAHTEEAAETEKVTIKQTTSVKIFEAEIDEPEEDKFLESPVRVKKGQVNRSEVAKRATVRNPKVIDVTPLKIGDPLKRTNYERERAALTALNTQRRMNGTIPLYITSHMNFKTRVFIDRIEYSGTFGKTVIPITKVSWVKLRAGGTGVIVETTAGKKVVMVVKSKDRLSFAEAVMKVQILHAKRAKPKDTLTIRIDELERVSEGIEEIEKLAGLVKKGYITQEEFDMKKRQILGL